MSEDLIDLNGRKSTRDWPEKIREAQAQKWWYLNGKRFKAIPYGEEDHDPPWDTTVSCQPRMCSLRSCGGMQRTRG